MLKLALNLLGDLSEELIFVGGSTTCLYINPEIADELRPTEDVDCIVETYSRKAYSEIEKKLRDKGFTHDTRAKAPICRFRYKDILILDVMPDDKGVLGFSNSWYTPGIKDKVTKSIEDKNINILSLPYFLASKFEAFENRGSEDPRFSTDLEDIILVLDGIKQLKINSSNTNLKNYLKEKSNYCLTNRNTIEAIDAFLMNQNKIK